MFDPELYRDKQEVEQWKQHCPIDGYTQRLRIAGALGAQRAQCLDAVGRGHAPVDPLEQHRQLIADAKGDAAEILADLTPGQMLKIAAMSTLLCQFRFDDQMIWLSKNVLFNRMVSAGRL